MSTIIILDLIKALQHDLELALRNLRLLIRVRRVDSKVMARALEPRSLTRCAPAVDGRRAAALAFSSNGRRLEKVESRVELLGRANFFTIVEVY